MTKLQFLSENTNGLYKSNNGVNQAYTLRCLVLNGLNNIKELDSRFNEVLLENGMGFISMSNVSIMDDKVAILNHEKKSVVMTIDYKSLNRVVN